MRKWKTSPRDRTLKPALLLWLAWLALLPAAAAADTTTDVCLRQLGELDYFESLWYAEHKDTVIMECTRIIEDPDTSRQDRGRAYYSRAFTEYGSKLNDRAIADFSSALEHGYPKEKVYNMRGHAFKKKGEPLDAMMDFKSALQLNPRNASALHALGEIYLDLGELGFVEYEDAVAIYNRLLRLYPGSSKYLVLRGICRSKQGKNTLALRDFNKALKVDPSNPDAYKARGELFEAMGDMARAKADFGKASEINEELELQFYGGIP